MKSLEPVRKPSNPAPRSASRQTVRISALVLGVLLLSRCISPVFSADFPDTVLSYDPVGYWRLNENVQPPVPGPATNVGSLGPNGNGEYRFGPTKGEPGALEGDPATSVKFHNPLLDPTFGGSKVEVPFNAALNPDGPFSVEFWAKPSTLVTDVFCMVASLNSDPAIGSSTNSDPRAGWLFYQYGSTNSTANQWQFRIGNAEGYQDNDSIRGGIVTTGEWHHIVGTFDGSRASLYVNGALVSSAVIPDYRPNDARPFRIGTSCFDGIIGPIGTYAGNRGFDGWLQEVAFYGAALTPDTIAAHYNTARTNGQAYASRVLSDNPIGYWRLGEPGNPAAANLGSLGAEADGRYVHPANPGRDGPQAPSYPGFDSGNLACGFDGMDGYVDVPPLNLHTNTVTITAWIWADGIQANNAGIVFCRAGTTVAGLKFDVNDPNGLSYNWNDDNAAYNFKSGLTVPVGQWCFVALIVEPEQATLCLQDGSRFLTAVNFTPHPPQTFDGFTLIGADFLAAELTFSGTIDEVAIFNRALSVGDVYSIYASAARAVGPSIFADLPAGETLYEGDTLTLRVDAGGTLPLGYQWRKDGAPIPGATSDTYSKAAVEESDSGTYDVIVSNERGSVTSQATIVSVQPVDQPQIAAEPEGRTVYAGGLLRLSVEASGGGLAYRWQKDGTDIPGATNAVYSVASASGSDSGEYRVVVSNRLGTVESTDVTVTVLVPAAGSYEEAIVQDSPEAWWRLDDPEGATTLIDAMGRHDGVYNGGVTLGTTGVLVGNTNSAAMFDGESGYAEVPFSRALNTTNFSIECWVKANPVIAALCPVSSFTQPPGRGYLFQKSEDGQWYYMFGDGIDQAVFVLVGSDAIYDKWTHLVITYDGTDYTAYLNGRLELVAGAPFMPNNIAPFRIGYDQQDDGWNSFWNGAIDEVAFYQKALSSERVAAHYAAALYGTNSGPVFVEEPEASMSVVGRPFFFAPAVEGSVPIQLQWSKNGVPLPGETNYFLLFPRLSYSDSGVYALAATNAIGGVVSEEAALVVLPEPAFALVTNDLVLHLEFEGDYRDSSGRKNDGSPVGVPTFVPGVVGDQALRVSTHIDSGGGRANLSPVTANYVTLGIRPDLQFGSDVDFSISYWVRFTGEPGDLPFFCNAINSYGNPGYTFAPSYELGGWSWSFGDLASSSFIGIYGFESINDGEWHHLVHTFDRSGSAFTYLDGEIVDTRSIVPAVDLDTGEPTVIGQDPTGTYPEEAEIDIDDVGVWRRVLTRFEVYSIYSAAQEGRSFDVDGPVSVAISSDGGAVQLVWQAGTLLEADTLEGPWSPIAGAAPPYYRVEPAGVAKFYRVQH